MQLGELVCASNEKAVGRKRDDWPYVGLEHLESGSPRLLGTAASSYSTSTNGIFRAGDVLFGKLRPYLRKSAGVAFEGYCSTDILVLRPRDGVDPGFAAKLLHSEPVFAEAVATSIGTKMPRTSWSTLSKLKVFCPPTVEQRRIAAILDTIDEAIRRTEQVIAKLRQVRQGLLDDLLSRGIDDNGQLRIPDIHTSRYVDSELGRLPLGWTVRTLAEVAEVRSGIAKNEGRVVSNACWVHYLRVANVQDGYLDLSEMSKIRISRNEIAKHAVRPGDLLMNEGGDLDKLGRGTIWRGEFEPCVHQNHVFVVRSGPSVLPDYLNAWTGTAPARRYFLVAGKQTTNLASINKTALGRLPVAVPSMAEQERIVSALAATESRIADEVGASMKLRAIKVGLTDDLLSGQVRVQALEEVGA